MSRLDPTKVRQVQRTIVRWYLRHQRDLPWRRTRDPYAILVSEIMLQQTQVDRVIPKYHAWLRQFPTVQRLARATPREVLLAWEGMGYNRRALYLHRAAREVVRRFRGRVPTRVEDLETLPGVGRYTAAAVATFATGIPHPLADTNVRRVTTRIFAGVRVPPSLATEAGITRLVEKTMLRKPLLSVPASHWGHALMDFGALICRAKPRCDVCPVRQWCRAYPRILKMSNGKRGMGSRRRVPHSSFLVSRAPDRIYRGRILQLVRERDPTPVPIREIGPVILPGFTKHDRPWLEGLLSRLTEESLLTWGAGKHAVRFPRS